MSATDNQMTRFLFAILKQKNLKDVSDIDSTSLPPKISLTCHPQIDWNAVARDPILTAPITNGHAARMRYSRFRSSMLGLEPQKRNRTPNNKNKVTKSKKDSAKLTATKREEDDDLVKPEPSMGDRPTFADFRAGSPAVNVKHEMSQHNFHSAQFTPTSMASPAGQECQPNHPMRLLTPCSDDMLSVPHNLHFSPQPALLGGFDLGSGPCGHEHDADAGTGNEPTSWAGSPVFPAFDYNLHHFTLPELAMFQQSDTQLDGMQGSPTLPIAMPSQTKIKSEQWDEHRR